MLTKVLVPRLGESVEEVTITRWLKKEGEHIKELEPLLEVNTDKVDTEIPSPAEGVVLKILIPEDQSATVGTLLAWIGEAGERIPDDQGPTATLSTKQLATPTQLSAEATEPQLITPQKRDLGFLSPVVKKIAKEYGIDLVHVAGSGKDGRITKRDVLAFIETNQKKAILPTKPSPESSRSEEGKPQVISTAEGQIQPLTPVRRLIAEHMLLSKHSSPHVTTVMEVDFSRVIAHRLANKDDFTAQGINLTYTAYIASASISALQAHPLVNSSWSDQGILIHRSINLGIATSLGEAGLIVPVIKNAETLSLIGLARTINDVSKRARSKQLQPVEVQGGTFTITNHGVSGSLFATPIINQPQCAILGAGLLQKRVMVIEDHPGADAIAIRPMLYLTLTFDHRILDGALADAFLAKVVELLRDWNL